MGEIKPLGSEKLKGIEKMNRILELTYFNQRSNNKDNSIKAELVEATTNGVYGIVREKDAYYVKKGLNEQSLDYIGGMFMKNKNRFSSYAEAYKRLDLLKGQELKEEATRYVLKQNKPQEEAPTALPTDDAPIALPPASDSVAPDSGDSAAPAAPTDDASHVSSDDSLGDSMEPTDDSSKRSDYMADIQKFAGKLGQSLRDEKEKMESDDIKYVINMVLSAVDIDKLDDEDKEEIGDRFDPEAEGQEGEEPSNDEEMPTGDEESEEPAPEPHDELAETMAKLEELINTKLGSSKEGDIKEFNISSDDTKEYDSAYSKDDSDELTSLGGNQEGEGQEGGETEIDITPELSDEINEAISTTLSKYFE